jgi:hypothetical protein
MSYHYPHHVGTIGPRERANSGAAEAAIRHSQTVGDDTHEILIFRRAERDADARRVTDDDRLCPKLNPFVQNAKDRRGVNRRDGAVMVGGILVALITAWLIWAAVAEAALAATDIA